MSNVAECLQQITLQHAHVTGEAERQAQEAAAASIQRASEMQAHASHEVAAARQQAADQVTSMLDHLRGLEAKLEEQKRQTELDKINAAAFALEQGRFHEVQRAEALKRETVYQASLRLSMIAVTS